MESEKLGPSHRGSRQKAKPGVRPGTWGLSSRKDGWMLHSRVLSQRLFIPVLTVMTELRCWAHRWEQRGPAVWRVYGWLECRLCLVGQREKQENEHRESLNWTI